MAEPLTLSLASSFNCINAYDKEIKAINQAIEKTIKGMESKCISNPPNPSQA